MTPEQRAAYIMSQVACAIAEIEAMKAENLSRKHRGESIAYTEESFMLVIGKYGIDHNSVVSFFTAK